MKQNATFHAFKASGKWYASSRGWLDPRVFKVFDTGDRRRLIIEDNDRRYPGLNGAENDFIFVVIGDDENEHGYPLMLRP